jgi:hypothetical protein
MVGTCPNCYARLEFPQSGRYQCERCFRRFEVALGSPMPPNRGSGVLPNFPQGAPLPPIPQPAASIPTFTAWTPPVAEALVDPTIQAPCPLHPQNAAAGVCERCGDFMCSLCTTRVEGRSYCPRCFDLLYQRGSLEVAQQKFTAPGITLLTGCIALFGVCPVYTVPLAIFGIVAGARGLREFRTRPDLPGYRKLIVGLCMNVLAILVAIGIVAGLIWAIVKNP